MTGNRRLLRVSMKPLKPLVRKRAITKFRNAVRRAVFRQNAIKGWYAPPSLMNRSGGGGYVKARQRFVGLSKYARKKYPSRFK